MLAPLLVGNLRGDGAMGILERDTISVEHYVSLARGSGRSPAKRKIV
jgi:hypothetical protein